jgi:hypothetical protein
VIVRYNFLILYENCVAVVNFCVLQKLLVVYVLLYLLRMQVFE